MLKRTPFYREILVGDDNISGSSGTPGVCLCRYAFGRALTYGAETWHGGRVWRAGGNRQLFVATRQVKGGQFVQECPMATKFSWKKPWPECSALLGSKVMQGSSGVNQGSNCLEMPYGHQIWWDRSLTKPKCIAGVKGHVGVTGVK